MQIRAIYNQILWTSVAVFLVPIFGMGSAGPSCQQTLAKQSNSDKSLTPNYSQEALALTLSEIAELYKNTKTDPVLMESLRKAKILELMRLIDPEHTNPERRSKALEEIRAKLLKQGTVSSIEELSEQGSDKSVTPKRHRVEGIPSYRNEGPFHFVGADLAEENPEFLQGYISTTSELVFLAKKVISLGSAAGVVKGPPQSELRFYDLSTKRLTRKIDLLRPLAYKFSDHSSKLVIFNAQREVEVFDLIKGEKLYSFPLDYKMRRSDDGDFNLIDINPSGTLVALAGCLGSVLVVDLKTGQNIGSSSNQVGNFANWMGDLQFKNDSEVFFTETQNVPNHVFRYDVVSGERVYYVRNTEIGAMVVAGGKLLDVSTQTKEMVFDGVQDTRNINYFDWGMETKRIDFAVPISRYSAFIAVGTSNPMQQYGMSGGTTVVKMVEPMNRGTRSFDFNNFYVSSEIQVHNIFPSLDGDTLIFKIVREKKQSETYSIEIWKKDHETMEVL